MGYTSVLVRYLYWATALLATIDAVVLFRRKLYREVPWFAIYLVFTAISMVVLEILWERDDQWLTYFAGWIVNGSIVTLASMFVLEGWQNLLKEFPAVRRLGRTVLIVIALVLLVVVAAVAPYGSAHSGYLMKVTLVAMRSVRFVLVGLIVAFFLFSSYLALSWKHFQFGILLAYGLYSASNLAGYAYLAEMGGSASYRIMVLDSAAYILTLIVWLTYLLHGEPSGSPPLPETAKADLEHWNEALTALMKR